MRFDRFDIYEAYWLFARKAASNCKYAIRKQDQLDRLDFAPGLTLRVEESLEGEQYENAREIYNNIIDEHVSHCPWCEEEAFK